VSCRYSGIDHNRAREVPQKWSQHHSFWHFPSINISSERTRYGSHSVSVHLQGFRFDLLVRFKMSFRSLDLNGSFIDRPVAILAMAFDNAPGNTLST